MTRVHMTQHNQSHSHGDGDGRRHCGGHGYLLSSTARMKSNMGGSELAPGAEIAVDAAGDGGHVCE